MSNMLIYQGKFNFGKTAPIGMLLYPNGDVYYGQINKFMKDGYGKLVRLQGGFQEGKWEQEKFTGEEQRIFSDHNRNIYIGPTVDGKMQGEGKQYDAQKDEVYVGSFTNDRR